MTEKQRKKWERAGISGNRGTVGTRLRPASPWVTGAPAFRLVLAVLLVAVAAALLPPERALAAAPPAYTIDATLEYGSGVVAARETVALTNTSSQDLDSLVFNVIPASYGAFQLVRAAVNGREVDDSLDGSILELRLPQPLPPGAAAAAALEFQIKVPVRGGRFGRGPQVMALGNWFPILAVYRDGRLLAEGNERGWIRGDYVEIGDAFFAQASDFSVTFRTDQPVKIAHTGSLLSQAGNTWNFEAKGVRDFAMAVSPVFSSVSRQVDGVEVSVFYLPGHAAAAGSYLQAAAETLDWLKRTVAPYPHKHLHLAEINSGVSTTVGQEYPGLIFMADSVASSAGGADSYGSILASHETAHQWFYGIIGNDQLYEPWLDEAIVTWLSYHLLRIDGVPSFDWIWQNRVLSPPIPDLPVNASVYTYPTEGSYLALAYRRGAVFMEELYQAMGDKAFFAALKAYGTAMSGYVGTPHAFLDTMQANTSANLNPIISRYFTYPRYQAAEPLMVSARYPEQPWSGAIKIALESSAELREVSVFVDDAFHMQALPGHIFVETSKMAEGRHLLTLRASDGRREVDLVTTINVKRPAPTPVPTPAPSPSPTPTTTATPIREATPTPGPSVEMEPPVEAGPAGGDARIAGVVLVSLSLAMLAWGFASKMIQGGKPDV